MLIHCIFPGISNFTVCHFTSALLSIVAPLIDWVVIKEKAEKEKSILQEIASLVSASSSSGGPPVPPNAGATIQSISKLLKEHGTPAKSN